MSAGKACAQAAGMRAVMWPARSCAEIQWLRTCLHVVTGQAGKDAGIATCITGDCQYIGVSSWIDRCAQSRR